MKKIHYLTAIAGFALLAGTAFAGRPEARKPMRVSAATIAKAAEADIPTDWVDMGQGKFTEDIITLYENYDAPTYDVTVQRDAAASGWYRIVNPFAGNPTVDDWSGCEMYDDKDYYIVINATDPAHVHIPMCEIGVNGFGDDLSLISVSAYPDPYELWLDDDEAAAMAGVLVDGVITFEAEESLVLVSEYGAEQTNISGAFRLELPSVSPEPGPEPGPDPLTPPFEESFATADFLNTFTVIDANRDGTGWTDYLGSAQISYNSEMAMDDWLITPALKLEGGRKYSFKVDVMTGSGSDKEAFEVMFGTSPAVDAMTGTVIARQEIAHTRYQTYDGIIAPAESGVYYVGIHGCSAADKYSISLKNLSIAEGASAATPAAPADLRVVTRTNGALKADITLTAPVKDLDGNDLKSLDCVRLMRGGELVHTFDAPLPGASLSWVDEVPECSRYAYSATAVADGLEGPSVEITAFVGVLEPANPASVTVSDGDEPGMITVEWQPVTTDIRGNALDAEYVTYRIYEGGTSTPLFTGLTGSSHTFKALDNVSGQTFVRYEVMAENRGGVSDYVSSAHHPVGAPYAAPYNESFADAASKYIFAQNPDNTAEWQMFNDDPEVSSQDGDNGFIASVAAYLDDVATMHTGKIDLAGLGKPELSMYVWVLVDGDKDPNELTVDVICDGESKPLYSCAVGDLSDTQGWTLVCIPLDEYKDKVVRLSFTARHNLNPYVFLDNILIDEEGAAGITAVGADTAGEAEYYNLQGIRVSAPADGIYIRRQGNTVTKEYVK
ncbi:MAG: choice-of-anchor J domain-containing protein [Bacteroidales bacterium]|nr:choice-of-anchor J domain-containing protein [Bacteroidales bacterium]